MKKQFTLTELLVVIAIIALLAATLMPALAPVRERARVSGCLDKLREIGIATLMYANDNQGHTMQVPHSRSCGGSYSTGNYCDSTSAPVKLLRGGYFGNENISSELMAQIFRCPDDTTYYGYGRPEHANPYNNCNKNSYAYIMVHHCQHYPPSKLRAISDRYLPGKHDPDLALFHDFGPFAGTRKPDYQTAPMIHPDFINILHLGGHVDHVDITAEKLRTTPLKDFIIRIVEPDNKDNYRPEL